MSTIDIQSVKKIYAGHVEALHHINLSVSQGEFFGLLGPNGAGKSTLIGILCALVTKTSGKIIINGFDHDIHPEQARLQLGIVPQEFNFNIFESCLQIVINQAGYYGVPRKQAQKNAEKLFHQLDLWEKRDTPSARLSGGMKRRLMIARALVHGPKILILDEPTAGVDITLRRSMWEFLKNLNEEGGMTIILTTHYLEEAESLCKRIAIINKGSIIADMPTVDLLKQLASETLIVYTREAVTQLPALPFPLTYVDDHTLEVELLRDQSVSALVAAFHTAGIDIDRIKNKANRLEELFVKLVGESS